MTTPLFGKVDMGNVAATSSMSPCVRAKEGDRAHPLFADPYSEWFVHESGRLMADAICAAFPPVEATIRYRTRYFNRWLERGIAQGIRQVVTLGAGMDMRPHLYATPGVTYYEVDQPRVLRYKHSVLAKHGVTPCPSLSCNYLEVDLLRRLAGTGFNPGASTLVLWEGNTMYLPDGALFPFLNRLAGGTVLLWIVLDHVAADMSRRDFEQEGTCAAFEGMERAIGASFTTGVPDLASFETETPFRLVDSGRFADLGEEYEVDEDMKRAARGPDDSPNLFAYCVLRK